METGNGNHQPPPDLWPGAMLHRFLVAFSVRKQRSYFMNGKKNKKIAKFLMSDFYGGSQYQRFRLLDHNEEKHEQNSYSNAYEDGARRLALPCLLCHVALRAVPYLDLAVRKTKVPANQRTAAVPYGQ